MGSGFAQGGGTVTTSFLTIGLFARPHRLRGRAFTLPFWRWWKPWRKGGGGRAQRAQRRGRGPLAPAPALVLRGWGPQGPQTRKTPPPPAVLPLGRSAGAAAQRGLGPAASPLPGFARQRAGGRSPPAAPASAPKAPSCPTLARVRRPYSGCPGAQKGWSSHANCGRQTKARGLGPKAPVPALSGRFAPRRRPPGRWGLCRRWQDPPYKHRARSFRRRYRLQRNRPLGGTYATPSMGETSVYTLRKWETGQIT